MSKQRILIEGLNPQAEVIHIAPGLSRRGAAGAAEFAVDRDQIDQRDAGAKLHEPKFRPVALDMAAEDIAIKPRHTRSIAHAQYRVVETQNMKNAVRFFFCHLK